MTFLSFQKASEHSMFTQVLLISTQVKTRYRTLNNRLL